MLLELKKNTKRLVSITILMFFAIAFCNTSWAVLNYYVSNSGSDSNPGSISQPFLTITKARDVIRALSHPISQDINVWIRGGTYRLTAPIEFGTADSGTTTSAITYQPYNNEDVLISGGSPITSWTVYSGNIWQANVTNGWEFRYLWVDGARQPRARIPNDPMTSTTCWRIEDIVPAASWKYTQLELDNNASIPVGWDYSKQDTEVVVLTDWTTSRDLVIDWDSGVIETSSTMGLANNSHICIKDEQVAWLENAFEFLDSPGEWYLDKTADKLFYYTTGNPNSMSIIAPKATQLIKVVGAQNNHVLNLHFNGLKFAHTDWTLPGQGYAGIQSGVYASGSYHPFEGVDRPSYMLPNAIHFEFARYCGLARTSVYSVAGNGVAFAFGCLDNSILGCEVTDTAGNGIMVGWIDKIPQANWYWWWYIANRQPYHVNKRNEISNTYVHDIGRDFFEAVGIFDQFSEDTSIVNNEIAWTPATPLQVGYCWDDVTTQPQSGTIVVANNIHHYNNVFGDASGIYTLGHCPGGFIAENWVHHNMRRPFKWTESPGYGIFLDQSSEGWLVGDNVLYLTQTNGFTNAWNPPINLHSALVNDFTDNHVDNRYSADMFRFDNTSTGDITRVGNVTLSTATDLTGSTVNALIAAAGIEPAYDAFTAYHPAAVLRHRYTFDNGSNRADDTVGSADMYLDHGPYTYPPGVTGVSGDDAIRLSGSSNVFAGIPLNTYGLELGDRFTLSMWIKPEEKTSSNNLQALISNRYVGSWEDGFAWTLNGFNATASDPDDGNIQFETQDGRDQTTPCSAAGVVEADTGWVHVATVVDKTKGSVKCYVDGVQVIDNVTQTRFATDDLYLFIGSLGTTAHNFKGSIDDLRIYEGIMDADEIAALTVSPAASLKHFYKFDAPGYTHVDDQITTVGNSVTMWTDHGPYTSPTPAGVTGLGGDYALGLTGQAGCYAGLSYGYFNGGDLGNTFSITMWIKPTEKTTGTSNNMGTLISNHPDPGNEEDGFAWEINTWNATVTAASDGKMFFETGLGTSGSNISASSSTGAVTIGGGWQHVAAVVDKLSGNVKCYVNGTQVINGSINTNFNTAETYLFVGTQGDNEFQGAIDKLRIYRGLLTQSEVQALYNTNQ